jgi:MarR family transcriptional regulator for hemolysin
MSTVADDVVDGVREPRRTIGLRLSSLARALRNNFDREVSALSVTRSQWAMIAVVAHRPGATQRLIAEALEMSEASAGRLIDRLCADGLLHRRERDDDRRARAIYLSDAAEPLLGKLQEFADQVEGRMLRGFSPDEIVQLVEYLDRIAANSAKG